MRIVLCYPVKNRHLKQIAEVATGSEVVDAGQDNIAEEIFTADIFCGHAKVPVSWDEVVAAGKLKWIQSSAAGLDHCLVPEVIKSNILVTGASGLFAPQVAEHAMALLLGVIRSLPVFFRASRQREFVRQPTRDLRGSTVLIVGFGGNGQRIADVLAPFGVRILATDLYPEAHVKPSHVEAIFPAAQLGELLPQVDILLLCVPLTELTGGMIDASVFDRMRKGSILVNVARGPVVIEDDLVVAVENGTLAGVGLDVTEVEPLDERSRLWELPNVLVTPHVGAQSATRYDDNTDFFCENLRRYRAGQPLKNVVDKQLGFPVPVREEMY